jgi:uncharacterized membrane protein
MFIGIQKFLDLVWKLPIVAQLKGALQDASVSAVRGIIGAVMAVLVANAAAGTLFPKEWGQVTIVILVGFVLAVDKWLREKGLEQAAAKATKTTTPTK